MREFFVVKWGNHFNDNFNYGADILFRQHGAVSYESPLMPAGTVIKTWKSKTNFSDDRQTPFLPLLLNGKKYHLLVDVLLVKRNSLQIKITFVDSEDQTIEELYLQDLNGSFIYPLKATNYMIQLVNKNISQLVFFNLFILEEKIYQNYHIKINSEKNIYIFEKKYSVTQIDSEIVITSGLNTIDCSVLDVTKNHHIIIFERDTCIETVCTYLEQYFKELNDNFRCQVKPYRVNPHRSSHSQLLLNSLVHLNR